MENGQGSVRSIWLTVILGTLLLTGVTLLSFLFLSDAFRKAPVVEIQPLNTFEETLVVVTDIDYEPFSYVDENGDYTGLDVELIAEIANRLHMNLDLTLTEWTNANELFFGGEADAFLNMETDLIITDERMIATLPTAEKQYVVYGRESVSSVAELYGKRVASLHRMPELGLPDITYFDSYAEIFEALQQGDYDFGICPIQVGNVFLEKMQMKDIVPSYAVSHIYGAIALSPENTELKEKMDTVIADLEKEGFLERLDSKWISNRYQSMTLSGMIQAHPMVGAMFVAGLMLLALLVFFLLVQRKNNEELRLAKERAEESNQAKTLFLSNMSHEIRTPINAVLGMNEMIAREADARPSADGNRRIASYAANVESAGKNLLSIINDILDFSKIDAGKLDIVPASYKLSSVLNDISNIALFRARDKGLQFFVEVDETLPDNLYGDEVRIKQVLTNVLTNAVKYTEEGSVTLSVAGEEKREDSLRLIFKVTDTGIGIKEEDLQKLYDRFERMERDKNRTIEGTGLGLAITKSLLTLMDGDISAESVYGKGSTFTVTLPQKVLSEEAVGDFKEKFETAMRLRPHYRETLYAPDAHVLIVDDTQMNLTVAEGLLSETGIQLETALSGAEALEKTKTKPFDLIFMDQMMPHMDGSETLHHLREQEDGLNLTTPVICLTADAVSGARERYLAEGFTDYLSKPVEGAALEEALRKYLPEEKVSVRTTEHTAQNGEGKSSALSEVYEGAVDLNYENAVKLCGSVSVLEKTLKQFAAAIDPNAEEIERFLKEEDYAGYTIKVHALKSSARLIGADALSKEAEHLELCGKAGDEAHLAEIKEKTPALLSSYRKLRDVLAPFLKEEETKHLPLMPEDAMSELLDALKRAAEEFDSDAMDALLEKASAYRLPETETERLAAITKAVNEMDWDALERVLE